MASVLSTPQNGVVTDGKRTNGYSSVVAVGGQEIYELLSTSRKAIERALVALMEEGELAQASADELVAMAVKLAGGGHLSYGEMMKARAEVRKWKWVTKLVQIALEKKANNPQITPINTDGQKENHERHEQHERAPVEPVWMRSEPELVKGRKWYEPPRWINARFAQVCSRCGKAVEQGFAALWFPTTRGNTCMCRECGTQYEIDTQTKYPR